MAVLAAALLAPAGIAAHADEGEKFLPQEIHAAFEAAEPYVRYGEYNHLVVDVESMRAGGIQDVDIEIMSKWAAHSNALVDAVLARNQTAIGIVIEDGREGQFSLMTNPPSTGGAWAGGGHAPIRQILTACGVTYSDNKWDKRPVLEYIYTGTASRGELVSALKRDGFGLVIFPSSDPLNDYQRINPVGKGGCTGGEYRDQRIIHRGDPRNSNPDLRTGWYTTGHTNEPNPQILSYGWPSFWWGDYVTNWHRVN
ncbi:MAG: hypothetical protein MPI95_02105 [Nitrosopumilus sp.]|nr:hypothetical protein [Nitrosopumilus sp.]MDA7957874.1 hypothetical protein [Nitrosopumilus sp.]MDA7996637.1 hypothetical protein [Nitrosopumilus sp.]